MSLEYPSSVKRAINPNKVETPISGHFSFFFDSTNGNKLSVKNSSDVVIAIGDLFIINGTETTPLAHRTKIRLEEFLEAVDDNGNGETIFRLNPTLLAQFNSPDITDVSGVFRLLLEENHLYFGGADGLAGQKTLTELFTDATQEVSNDIFHVVDNKLELLVPTDEIIVGDALQRGRASTIGDALGSLSIETGIRFKVGIDGKVAIDLPEGWIIRGNANGEGVAEKLIQGNNKVLVTDESGVEQEVDLVYYQDTLSAIITGAGIINTFNLAEIASGLPFGFKVDAISISNVVGQPNPDMTFSIGTGIGTKNVVMDYVYANAYPQIVPVGNFYPFNLVGDDTAFYFSFTGTFQQINISFKISKIN